MKQKNPEVVQCNTADLFLLLISAVTSRIGYEEQIPGQLRDWNEELQSAKELPKKTQHQRILRDRALFKVMNSFQFQIQILNSYL